MHSSLRAVFAQQPSVLEDICHHLTRLLNTRQGSYACCADYGLIDNTVLFQTLPDSLYAYLTDIQRLIEQYEPRLQGVSVEYLSAADHQHRYTFLIKGHYQQTPLQLNAHIAPQQPIQLTLLSDTT